MANGRQPLTREQRLQAVRLLEALQRAEAQEPAGGGIRPSLARAAEQTAGELGPLQRFRIASESGVRAVGRGIRDLAADIGLVDQPTEQERALTQEREQIFEAGIGQTTAGQAGRIVGEALPFVAGGTGLAAGLGRVGLTTATLPRVAGLGAVEGAIAGGLQETADQEAFGDQRVQNILQGGLIGAAAGGALETAARLVGRTANIVRGRLTPEAEESFARAEQFGIPLSVADIHQQPLLRRAGQDIIEAIPFSGGPRFRRQQATAAREAAEAELERFKPIVNEEIGETLQRSLRQTEEAASLEASRRYRDVGRQLPNPIVPSNTIRAAQSLIDEQSGVLGANSRALQLARTATESDPKSFLQLKLSQSNIGDEEFSLRLAGFPKAARLMGNLRRALADDIADLTAQGGPDVARQLKEADR